MGTRIAFIGLGVMGSPMAGHLAAAGHSVRVYNRSRGKIDAWLEEHAGEPADSAADAAAGAELVFCCVGNDDDVREVTTGPHGAFSNMPSGAVFVDHTTTSAELARELAAAATERGIHFIDAPVSGGQSGAAQGRLTVMAGGDEEAFARARPAIECYAHSVRRLGPAGSGQLTKMVNQICVAGLIQALAEGIHFARHAELDIEAVISVISRGAAQSWQMENRWQTMRDGEYDFGFAVDWMRKDLGIVLQEARRNGARLPITAIVDQLYAQLQAMGGNRWDTSSLLALLDAGRRL